MDTNTNPMENNMSTVPLASLTSSVGRTSSGPKKNTPIWLIVVAVVVLVLIVWWVNRPNTQEDVNLMATPTPILVQDELQQEVEQIDLGDVNSEFDQIDQDLNTL